jgi:O-antigen/teichoic acid export membrane protein
VLRRAFLFTSIERYLNLAINFSVIAIVSRLLTPEEIGISVIGVTLLMVIELLRDVPSTYLVQQKELSREDIRTAFTAMALLSTVLVTLMIGFSDGIARAFNKPDLASYVCLIAVASIPGPFERPIMALLRRDMAFGKLAVINVTTYVVHALVTVPMVALDFGYMSFGWAYLAANTMAAILAIGLRREFWMFRPLLSEWRRAIRFGGYVSAHALLTKSQELVPYLVLSRLLPLDAVGLFNRAMMISDTPNKLLLAGLSPVIFPALAAEARAGRSLKQPYLLGLAYITALQWPAFLLLALLAHPAVEILFGQQWLEIVPLVQLICIAMLFSFTARLNYPTLVATGAMRGLLATALIGVPICLAVTSASALVGLQAVALSTLFRTVFQAIVEQYFLRRHVSFAWTEFGQAIWRSALVALCSVVGPLGVMIWAGGRFDLSIAQAACAAASAPVGWLAGLRLTRHPMIREVRHLGQICANASIPWIERNFRPGRLRLSARGGSTEG